MATTPKKSPDLDPKLMEQEGMVYDHETNEYVNAAGHRIPYADWHIPVADASSATGPQEPLTDEDFAPRNVKEKMSVWFEQDVLDELRRIAKSIPGAKMARLINDALRAVYLPAEATAPGLLLRQGKLPLLSEAEIRAIVDAAMAQERQERESMIRELNEKVNRIAKLA